jgi:hypothetical protein
MSVVGHLLLILSVSAVGHQLLISVSVVGHQLVIVGVGFRASIADRQCPLSGISC